MGQAGAKSAVVACLTALAALVPTTVASATPAAATRPATAAVASHRAQAWGIAEEQAFVERINQLRTGLGLAPLATDVELTAQARAWSVTMKDAGNIFHTTTLEAGISADWEKLGENVGVGGTVDALFDAFVASPKHYENLVDPVYRFVGVGVVWDGSRMFTTHRFMSLLPPAPVVRAPAPTTTATTAPDPTTTTTTTAVPPTELAATTADAGLAAGPTPPAADGNRIRLVLDNLGGIDD